MPWHPPRKHPRLDPDLYAEEGRICFITTNTKERQNVFANAELANVAIETIITHSQKSEVPVYAYCVMQDHLHLLISASSRCDIITFVGQVKNLITRASWQHGVEGSFWQKSFWDHFLREEESVEQVAEYILDNPVRKGMVKSWREYPYSGSLVLEME